MKCSFLAPLALSLLLAGCATTALKPASTQAVNFTVVSPLTRTSDAGFMRKFKNQTEVQIYASGISVLSLVLKGDKICMNGACDDELVFNKKFFGAEHYRGLLGEILVGKPIFGGSDTGGHCFEQSLQDGSINYKVCRGKDGGGRSISFADAKRGVKIKIRELQ
jgi:putative lipoprotein